MLKAGVSKSTGKVFTPAKKYEYDVAYPKILSTYDDFWKDTKFYDIKHRFIIIPKAELIEDLQDSEYINDVSLFKLAEEFWLSAASDFERKMKSVEGINRDNRELIATMTKIYDFSVSEAVEKVSIYQEFVKKYF